MKNRWTMIAGLIALVLVLLSTPFSFAQAPVGNRVSVQLNHDYDYSTDKDSIVNDPLVWDHRWHPLIHNILDGGPPVLNPKVELQSNLNLVRFHPDDPSVFTAQPDLGLYAWYFEGLEIKEPALLPLHAWMPDTLTARPRFTASRSVEPQILVEDITFQTITMNFRLEEPLLPQVNWLMISIGSPVIAYEEHHLVEGYFVSQIPVEGWYEGTDGVQAWWVADPATIEVGKTYNLQATLKAVKSPELSGSPIFKPGICIQYGYFIAWPPITATSVTITDPDNIISATYTSDNVVDWEPVFRDPHFTFWFLPIVSQVTPPPPPFHVIIYADVDIKPETLNLKSKGVFTAFIKLPEQYNVNDIDLTTVTCEGAYAIRGVVDGDILIVKFRRQGLQNVEAGEEVELTVTGQLTDGSIFKGIDTIRVIY